MTELQDLGIHPKGRGETRADCPHCLPDGKQNTVGVNTKSGVYHCFRCGWAGRVGGKVNQPTPLSPPLERQRWSPKAQAIWDRSLPLRGSVVETYLRARDCVIPPPDGDLRYLEPSGEYPPTMVGRVTDFVTCEPLTLHFTPLLPDGSGYVRNDAGKKASRLLRGHQKAGGVIRLWPDDAVTTGLGLGEGIETALSLAHGYVPVWATVDSGNLEQLPVVGGIESLVLAEDGDEAGGKACSALARRWREAGREVYIIPSENGKDLNDV